MRKSFHGNHINWLPMAIAGFFAMAVVAQATAEERPWVKIRGVYGGLPALPQGKSLKDFGINAVWVGSGGVSAGLVDSLHRQGVKIFAEFNTMHDAGYLKEHPDAAPIGIDGRLCPPPNGWQGVCPTHPGYRRQRMQAFRETLAKAELDGIWLDYHHSHASWEQAIPDMPLTCFCDRCVKAFAESSKVNIPQGLTIAKRNRWIVDQNQAEWVTWRCGVFTDWVREFREIVNQLRPGALLGTFHNPWSPNDYDGAIKNLLAIDLKAQSKYIDVFSIMPYHARFGHHRDPAWISRQVLALAELMNLSGEPGEKNQIWPIVQLADWGEVVQTSQIKDVMDHGTRQPVSGVTIFHTGGLNQNPDRLEALGQFYREIGRD
ncbi:MAG: hypothetical protein ACKO0V_02465 [bacterium]